MDKSAIEQIQLAQAVRETQESVDHNSEIYELLHPLQVTHKDFQVNSLERYMPNRARFTGSFRTGSIADFTEFSLKNTVKEQTKCFIDGDGMAARVIFNLGNQSVAGHADFHAFLELQKTSEYRALMDMNGGHHSQKTLAEFMEDWIDFITPLDKEGEPISPIKAISAVRRLTIEANAKSEHEVQDFRSTRSALENVEAKTDNGLPSEILFQCVPFNELSEFNFYARISVITGETPKLSFRIKRLDKVQDEIMEDFKELVVSKIGKEIPTYLGVFNL